MLQFLLVDAVVSLHNVAALTLLLLLVGYHVCSSQTCLRLGCVLLTQLMDYVVVRWVLVLGKSRLARHLLRTLDVNDMSVSMVSNIWRVILGVVSAGLRDCFELPFRWILGGCVADRSFALGNDFSLLLGIFFGLDLIFNLF